MIMIETINNVAKAYQDLAVVLFAVADKTVEKLVTKATKLVEKSITIEQVRTVMTEKS